MIPLLALLAATATKPICDDRSGDVGAVECWAKAFQSADAQLNALWPQLLKAAGDADRDFKPSQRKGEPSANADILEAERNWIAWRDAECAARGDWAQGGSLEKVIQSRCLYELTHQRVRDLQQLISDFTEQ